MLLSSKIVYNNTTLPPEAPVMNFTYESEHLIFRVLTSEDAPAVLTFYEENKSFFEPWEASRPDNFYTEAYQRAILNAEYNQIFQKKGVRFHAFLKNNPDVIIGTFCLHNIVYHIFQSCSLGYKVHATYARKGYGTEMVSFALWIAFHELQLHKIEALVHPKNIPSQKLLEKLHFILEGTSLDAVFLNGKWEDHLRYVFLHNTSAPTL